MIAAPSFTVIDCEQKSPEWYLARSGRLTSSVAADMLATIKTGEAAARRNLRVKLALERITGRSLERDFQSQAMRDGNEREADAYAAYEALTGTLLERTGFIQHPTLMAGCSLDGWADGGRRIIEIKCPTHAVHLKYLQTGRIPDDYEKQMLHSMWITGAESCAWMSYQPDFPEHLRVKLVNVSRNPEAIQFYEDKATAFLAEVEAEVAQIRSLEA